MSVDNCERGSPIDYHDRFVQTKRPTASAYDLESLKHFVLPQGESIIGIGDRVAGVETLQQYWNLFTGAWKRRHPAIPSDILESVKNVSSCPSSLGFLSGRFANYVPIQYIYLEVAPQLGLLKEKRPRRYPGRKSPAHLR